MKNICVVCEYGWILQGLLNEEKSGGETMYLNSASVVRSWNNGKGIGGIASEAYKDDYILDEIGDVEIQRSKILFTIPCEW